MERKTAIEIGIYFSLGIPGAIINFILSVYFIKQKDVPSKIFMVLAGLDFIVCSHYGFLLVALRLHYQHLLMCMNVITKSAIAASGITTTILSIFRYISIKFPRCYIKPYVIWTSFLAVTVAYQCFGILFFLDVEKKQVSVGLFILNIPFFIVHAITNFCTYNLVKKKINGADHVVKSNKRHAAVTVMLISFLFCATNSIAWTAWLVRILIFQDGDWIEYFVAFFMINSITNPLILIVRKRKIRQFIVALPYSTKMPVIFLKRKY